MRSLKSKELYKKIAVEYNISTQQVEDIVCAPFEFQAYIQGKVADKTQNKFPAVRIPFFGTFQRNARAYSLYLRNKEKNESINIEQTDLGD